MKTNHLLLAALTAAITMPLLPVAESVGQTPSTTVVYTYDASGNRIKRAIKNSESNPMGIAAMSDSIHIPLAVATPNPTTGFVSVELVNTDEPIAIGMGLYSLEGTHLKDWGAFSESIQIDLSAYPSGWYVIHVNIGQTIESIKILKL